MSNLNEALNFTNKIAKQRADLYDSAIAQYIKSQAEYIVAQGKDLTEYELVSGNGSFVMEDDKVIGNIRYGLVHKDTIKDVRYPEEQS